ncbi:MAG TPA: AsmA family protein [Candidatus Limnocylindrales bacterium]|nr:AsmA family protein [Candidatus Limnocylindrales bacterium]
MRKKRIRRWITLVAVGTALFALADLSLSQLMASKGAHRILAARLTQQFGRSVEVGWFDFQLLPRPGIVANQVTIAEDPRFGNEYFLRAESVAASPRWGALLAGRLEIGTLQLLQPSLNLVRNPDGKWNVESWLPPATASGVSGGSTGQRAPHAAAKLFRIVIDRGRINFNQGVDRRPFALVDLAGSIEQQSPGVWDVALTARPQRATVHLQNSGMLRLAGHIAGTTARSQPAELVLTWSDASLADALRLAVGRDPGVRGGIQMQVTARTVQDPADGIPIPARWSLSLSADVDGLHRWDMASRGDNPALDVKAEAAWKAGALNVELNKLRVQAPRSNIEGAGSVDWSHGIEPKLKLTSLGVAFDDLLAWYRSFQPGVAEGISASGFLRGKTELHGWPIRVDFANIAGSRLALNLGNTQLVQIVGLGANLEQNVGALQGAFWFPPGNPPLAVGSLSNSPFKTTPGLPHEWLTVSGVLGDQGHGRFAPDKMPGRQFKLELNASVGHGERVLAAARALGRPLNNSWDAKGGLDGHLAWQWRAGEGFPRATGEMTAQEVTLQLPVFNQALEIVKAKVELKTGERRVTIADASGLGAHWEGTISQRDGSIPGARFVKTSGNSAATETNVPGEWEFDLAVDRLEATELDRWIGPRSRPGWLARFFTQTGSTPSQILTTGPIGNLRARGNLRVDAFALTPLEVQKLNARIELSGRSLDVSEFDAKMYGGSIAGNLHASLGADPAYLMRATVSNVSATELAAANPALDGRVSGQLSGDVRLSMHGIGRESLLNSLQADGRVSAAEAIIKGLSFSGTADGSVPSGTQTPFSLVNAEFSVEAHQFKFARINLLDGSEYLEGRGLAGFDHALHFDFGQRQVAEGITKVNEQVADRIIRISGLLEAPHVTYEVAPAGTLQPAQRSATPPNVQGAPRTTRTSSPKTTRSPAPKTAPGQSPPQVPPQPVAHIARH